jgi:putative flippase GtrA
LRVTRAPSTPARDALRFGAVGVANTLIGATLIITLTWAGANPFIANCIGYVVGTLFSFYANARWTFASRPTSARMWKFTAVIAAAYCVNVAVLALALQAGWGELASQLPAMVCFTLFNFAGQRYWTFRDRGEGGSSSPSPPA